MAKSQQTPERLALAAAHADLAAAQQAVADAEGAYRDALSVWAEASRDADGLETHLARLQDRRDPGIHQVRHEYADQVVVARAALQAEEARIQPFKRAYDEARDRIPEAQRALDAAQAQVTAAVRRVVAAEAEPVARAALARLTEAYAAALEAGPDLLVMVEKDLLPPDLIQVAETTAGGMLRRMSGSPEFSSRFRSSPWRVAAEKLRDDPAATLPQAAAS
jgi:chromosome segregation ATPase